VNDGSARERRRFRGWAKNLLVNPNDSSVTAKKRRVDDPSCSVEKDRGEEGGASAGSSTAAKKRGEASYEVGGLAGKRPQKKRKKKDRISHNNNLDTGPRGPQTTTSTTSDAGHERSSLDQS